MSSERMIVTMETDNCCQYRHFPPVCSASSLLVSSLLHLLTSPSVMGYPAEAGGRRVCG